MGADVQNLEESTSSVPNMGNEPVTDIPPHNENNENEIYNGNETVNIPPLPSNDIRSDIHNVQVLGSSSDEEDYYTIDSPEM